MKTKIYTLTLLALIIQVMVNSQTPGNQTRKIRKDIFATEKPKEQNREKISPTEIKPEDLLKQANYFDSVAKNLYTESKNRLATEKEMMIKEMNYLIAQGRILQVEASNLSAKLANEKFKQKRIILNELMTTVNKDIDVLDQAQNFILVAEHAMKLALEIREEADLEKNISAKLGVLGNAEEEEKTAANNQDLAINLLKKVSQNNTLSLLAHAFVK